MFFIIRLHHKKNALFLPGILYKGNGENQFISQQPPVVSSIMGNGRRRSISCPSCNGQADGNKLLAPVALACGIDGSLYVGDFNYVRRIFPSGNVTSVLELRYVFPLLGTPIKDKHILKNEVGCGVLNHLFQDTSPQFKTYHRKGIVLN